MLEAAQHADRLGYDSLWTWDHFYAHVGPTTGDNFEAWTVMSALAAVTTVGRLGVLVSAATYRHPVLVAKQASTLDHVSSGRAALGIGAGWFEIEHQQLGFSYGSTGERLARLRETAHIARSLLRGETVDFAGTFYTLKQATLHPLPVQAHLPIVIGGGGESVTLGIVARYADVWNFYGTLEALARKSAILDEHCRKIGRDPQTIARSVCLPLIVRNSAPEVERRLEAVGERNGIARADLAREAGETIGGSPDYVAERIRNYLDLGFSEVIAMGPAPYDDETIERLAAEVFPLLRA